MTRALIIIAHGSSVNPETARSVSEHADALREREAIRAEFDVVEARYLKQTPDVTDTPWATYDEAVVIPFFMADGWFVRKILPKKLGCDPFDALPARRKITGCEVTITQPLGLSEKLVEVVRDVADELAPGGHLIIVGHGTPRHPDSTDSVREVAAALAGSFASVTTRFVDDDPALADTWDDDAHAGETIVIVPYFAFAGPHVLGDIPELLGLPDATRGPHAVAGRTVFYGEPVGVRAGVVEALERLAVPGGARRP